VNSELRIEKLARFPRADGICLHYILRDREWAVVPPARASGIAYRTPRFFMV
jgi:hypothetical protein